MRPEIRAQLAFSWRSAGSERRAVSEEDVASPRGARGVDAGGRRVTFAVQNVPPSPLVYHAHHLGAGDGDDQDGGREPTSVAQSVRPAERPRQPVLPAKKTATDKRGAAAAAYSPKAKPKPRARPGWDDQVARDSSLFDASLKRSALFQARPGDRRREAGDEEMQARDRQVSLSKRSANQSKQPAAVRRPAAVSGGKMTGKWREARSSGYMAPASYQLPRRPKKNFVKENIKQMTGRSLEVLPSDKRLPRPGRSKNVFERLTAPRVNDLLVRTHGRNSDTAIEARKGGTEVVEDGTMEQPTTPDQAVLRPHLLLETALQATKRADSAQISIASEQERSILGPRMQSSRSDRSRSPSPLAQSSPQQATAYHLTGHRGGSSRSPPSPRQSRNSREPQQPSYAARVFAVLDRNERKRIGVDQVLQGLRLLGLPATHNQISDYVYLIHEGRSTTIDLEEWEILVGTLDAASHPSESAASLTRAETGSERSAFSLGSPDRGNVRDSPPPNRSPPRSSPHMRGSTASSMHSSAVDLSRHSSPNCGHESPASSSLSPMQKLQHQELDIINEDIDDTDVRAVQRCVDEMCQQAGAVTSLNWANGTRRNNQADDDTTSSSRHALNRAAAVVYNLKASLFPLVHQAEETLKEIRQRQGFKLSVVLSPEDIQMVARNSEMLASAILDDVLLDTVQLLNDEEKHQTQRQVVAHHAGQLDDILSQIQQIEQDELLLLAQHTVPPFTAHADASAYAWDSSHSSVGRLLDRKVVEEENPATGSNAPSLVLPLEVLMNVKISDEDEQVKSTHHEHASSGAFASMSTPSRTLPKESGILSTLPTIKTSVLQGKRLQSIEKRRIKFLKHRRLVEAALSDTGMAQSAVIEILEELMVMDIIEETAAELEDTVGTISDTIVTNLL